MPQVTIRPALPSEADTLTALALAGLRAGGTVPSAAIPYNPRMPMRRP